MRRGSQPIAPEQPPLLTQLKGISLLLTDIIDAVGWKSEHLKGL